MLDQVNKLREKGHDVVAIGKRTGKVKDVVSRFDYDLCKFAVDVDNVYFTPKSITDLISLRLDGSPKHQFRAYKYSRKGFFINCNE